MSCRAAALVLFAGAAAVLVGVRWARRYPLAGRDRQLAQRARVAARYPLSAVPPPWAD